jgi:hypothetical protein
MKMKKHALSILFILTTLYLFCGEPVDSYLLVNNSEDDIFITYDLKDIIGHNNGIIPFFKDDVLISNIYIIHYYPFAIKKSIPKSNFYDIGIFFIRPNYEITPKDIFHSLVEEFIVYDIKGNIIMTIDDIDEESFTIFGSGARELIIYITQETIENGRRKYGERKQ